MDTSQQGREFIRLHEGNPLTAYLDPVGVPTIGTGFTNGSATVTKMLGKIVAGKTKITASQSDRIFAAMLAEEYEPPVAKGMPGAKQHEFDAGVSVCVNLGPKSQTWTWADLWRAGKKKEAAAYLGSHYNTADGRKLAGLVRRRKEEATLLYKGVYTGVGAVAPEGTPRTETATPPVQADPVVKEAQVILADKGFEPGKADGWMGAKTRAAIVAYQKAHPHLKADGILGPATLAQLRRDALALKDALTKGGGLVGTVTTAGGAVAAAGGFPWMWVGIGGGVLAIVVAAYFAYRYRDVIQRHWNTATGKTVAV